jgi:DNA-binding CsgD family transcriptional regulator
MFGLTPAESRLAEMLVSGLTVQEAALQLFISAHTAKTHLKRILSKTGTRRQSELVSLLLSIGAPIE